MGTCAFCRCRLLEVITDILEQVTDEMSELLRKDFPENPCHEEQAGFACRKRAFQVVNALTGATPGAAR